MAFPALLTINQVWRAQITITSIAPPNNSLKITRRLTGAIANQYVAYKESKLTSGQLKALPATPATIRVDILKEQQYTV